MATELVREGTPLSSLRATALRVAVPPSENRIFQHTVHIGNGVIQDPSRAIIIATPQTDHGNSGGTIEAGLNSVSITVGKVTQSEIEFCFRRVDYWESPAPGMFINLLIME